MCDYHPVSISDHTSPTHGARCCVSHVVVVVNCHVHLPGQVVGEVELVGRVTHGDLVKPAVAQTDGCLGSHDLEGGVLGLVGEQPTVFGLGARHVIHALVDVGGGGILEERKR